MDRGPRWKRLDPEARREQILEVAEEAFARRPPQEVSLTEIATAAGVSRALVAHYFGGRHGLELAVQRRVLGLGEDAIATDRGTSIVDTVQRNVSAWLDFAEGNQEVTLRLNVFAGAVPDRPSEALVDETRERIIDTMLVNHFGTTEVSPAVRLVFRAYTGFVQAAVADWLVHGRATRAQVQTMLVRTVLALVRDVAPALAREPGPSGS